MLAGTHSTSTPWAPYEMLMMGFTGNPQGWQRSSGVMGPGNCCPPWEPRAAATSPSLETWAGPRLARGGFTHESPKVLGGVCLLVFLWDEGRMRGFHASMSLWGEQSPGVSCAL